MPKIELQLEINAPREICFDLARSIDLHQISLSKTNEKAVAGKTSGIIELGETVTWRATHFGISQKLTAKITRLDFPNSFRDEMVQGAFKCYTHDHIFKEKNDCTVMLDVFDFESPLGWIGKAFNQFVLKKYMMNLLTKRNLVIKDFAENGKWKEVLKKS